MRAIALAEPGRVAVVERPDPEPAAPDDAVVRVEATGICGSDLHMLHGRVPAKPGFVLGHEYVGEVVAAGDAVTAVAVGDRVLGAFAIACGTCIACRRAQFQHCDEARLFGLGAGPDALQGTQADFALVPRANLTLRRVPEGLSDRAALFAGDVMSTGYHAVAEAGLRPGESCAVVGLGPVGLCAAMAARVAGAHAVLALDTVAERLEAARQLGATPIHVREEDAVERVHAETGGHGADVVVEAVGSTRALATACRVARKGGTVSIVGAFAEPAPVNMGLVFAHGLRLVAGVANVIGHLDRVLALMAAGRLDPSPLVTHELALADAEEAYAAFDRREALKVLLRP